MKVKDIVAQLPLGTLDEALDVGLILVAVLGMVAPRGSRIGTDTTLSPSEAPRVKRGLKTILEAITAAQSVSPKSRFRVLKGGK